MNAVGEGPVAPAGLIGNEGLEMDMKSAVSVGVYRNYSTDLFLHSLLLLVTTAN